MKPIEIPLDMAGYEIKHGDLLIEKCGWFSEPYGKRGTRAYHRYTVWEYSVNADRNHGVGYTANGKEYEWAWCRPNKSILLGRKDLEFLRAFINGKFHGVCSEQLITDLNDFWEKYEAGDIFVKTKPRTSLKSFSRSWNK